MAVEALSVELEEEEPPSFCKNVGWGGVGLYALALLLGGVHLYIAAEYTYYFYDMHTEHVWVFFAFASLYLLLVVFHCLTWRTLAKETTSSSDRPSEISSSILQKVSSFKANFDVNGKWFQWKMYASELSESCLQVYNLVVLYTCTLPPGAVSGLCLFLCLDHGYRVYSTWQPNTAARRDRQILVDLCSELLCMGLPLTLSWFAFQIPLTMREMLSVVAWPSVGTALKLDELMEQNVRRRTTTSLVGRQRKRSTDLGRRRASLFGKTIVEVGVDEQGKRIGRKTRWGMTVFTGVAGAVFFGTGIAAVAVRPDCDPVLWSRCHVQVPFCGFQVACNCAVLQIKKHNMTRLPRSIESMTAMKKMEINHGPLKELPDNLGLVLNQLALLNVDFNKLKTLPASLAEAPYLTILYASFNEIASVPEALFQHQGIVNLDLSTNNITHLPKMDMTRLMYLFLSNNSLPMLPESLFDQEYIVTLNVNGNRLTALPANIGNSENTLDYFCASRNNLTYVPASFRKLGKLSVLDLRNNSFAGLPDWLGELESLTHLTVAGNPLCRNGWVGSGKIGELMKEEGQGCALQCSEMCLDIMLVDTLGCDHQCNIPNCNYDNGKCI